ncbi:hypothetical protein D3C86_679160 [compost metagenome]
MAGIGGTAPGVIHAADPGDEDAAGDGDQRLVDGAVVVEHLAGGQAVGTGAFTGGIGRGAEVAVQTGPLHLGLVGQLGEVGGAGIDHTA